MAQLQKLETQGSANFSVARRPAFSDYLLSGVNWKGAAGGTAALQVRPSHWFWTMIRC